jgi:hypothetical protein
MGDPENGERLDAPNASTTGNAVVQADRTALDAPANRLVVQQPIPQNPEVKQDPTVVCETA